jgi:aryl-alcohol dehydrogenase-like predicted oxidoreductase
MRYRLLGKTGLKVSEIGYGTWGIGGLTNGSTSYGCTDDIVSKNALLRAVDLGINFFDTSNIYGKSENLIGEVFSKSRDKIIIATKAGYAEHNAAPDFSKYAVERSVKSSLVRLNTEYIDLLQLHNPTVEVLTNYPDTFELLKNLKKEGKIRSIGISVKQPTDIIPLLKLFEFETVQANFNILDNRVLRENILNEIYTKGCGFIARTPLAFGFLTGHYHEDANFPIGDHRSRFTKEQIKLWVKAAKEINRFCSKLNNVAPSLLALRYCLSYEQVSTTIPGMLTEKEVEINVGASMYGGITEESKEFIENYNKEFDISI